MFALLKSQIVDLTSTHASHSRRTGSRLVEICAYANDGEQLYLATSIGSKRIHKRTELHTATYSYNNNRILHMYIGSQWQDKT